MKREDIMDKEIEKENIYVGQKHKTKCFKYNTCWKIIG